MFQIDDPSAATTMPAMAVLGSPGWFQGGSPTGPVASTKVRADWLNQFQAEAIAILTAAGLTPDATKANLHQLADAIAALIAAAQGNFATVAEESSDATFTVADYGKLLRLQSTAAANSTFTIATTHDGAAHWVENNSGKTLTVTSDGVNRFVGLTAAAAWSNTALASFVLPARSAAFIAAGNGFWNVIYNSSSFDVAGAAAAAQTAAQTYAAAQAAAAVTTAEAYTDAAGLGTVLVQHDRSGARSLGTTYTNSTGKGLFVSVFGTTTTATTNLTMTIDGVLVMSQGTPTTTTVVGVCGLVPPGKTYAVSIDFGSLTSMKRIETG